MRQGLILLVTLITVGVNILANALPLNGQGTGEISDRFAIVFVPAGYVFSIWGLIYLGLLAFAIYQAMPQQKDNALIERIFPAYLTANLANSVWVFLWHYEAFLLTLLAMVILLVSLLAIYLTLTRAGQAQSRNERWLVRAPFSLYLGWISVATIANISQVLFFVEWGGWGIAPETWAAIMLVIATLLGLTMLWRERDWLYTSVLVWAFIGIAVKQAAIPLAANSAWVLAALLGVAIFVLPKLTRRSRTT